MNVAADTILTFRFFYLLAFLATTFLLIFFGLKRGFTLRVLLICMAYVSVFSIIGSRLFTIPLQHWGEIVFHNTGGDYHDRSAVGALLFGLLGLLLCQRFMRVSGSLLDLYALIAPIGLGIQKFGCFTNGCCYGVPANLPWGVSYSMGANAHYHQWENGLLAHSSDWSLALHPVQLYEAVLLLSLGAAVIMMRSRWKQKGSLMLFTLMSYLAVKFMVSFFREPQVATEYYTSFPQLTAFQWILIAASAASLFLLIVNERYHVFARINPINRQYAWQEMLNLLIPGMLAYLFSSLFTLIETWAFIIKFAPAVILSCWYLYRLLPVPSYRLAAIAISMLPLMLIAQELISDSTGNEETRKEYKQIDFGSSFGTYNQAIAYNPHAGDCGTAYDYAQYRFSYGMLGGGYSKTIIEGTKSTTYGLNGYLGFDSELNRTFNTKTNYFIGGLNPYVYRDARWVGLGGGLHVGSLRWVSLSPVDKVTLSSGTVSQLFMPMFHFRVGRRDIVDLRFNYAASIPSALPVNLLDISIGSGFGLPTDYSFRLGMLFPPEESALFFQSQGLISHKLGFKARLIFSGSYYDQSTFLTAQNPPRFEASLFYRFGETNGVSR